MNVLAEVIDESIRGMEGGLVSKAEQEKVSWGDVSGSGRAASRLIEVEEKMLAILPYIGWTGSAYGEPAARLR